MIKAYNSDKQRLVKFTPSQDVSGRVIWANVYYNETYVKTVNNVVPEIAQSFISVVADNPTDAALTFLMTVRGRTINALDWQTIALWNITVPALDVPQLFRRAYSKGEYRDVEAVISDIDNGLMIREYYLSRTDIGVADGLVVGGKAGEQVTVPCDFTGMSPSSQYSIVFEATGVGVVSKNRLRLINEDGYTEETPPGDIVTFERPQPQDDDLAATLQTPVIGSITHTATTASIPYSEVDQATGYEYQLDGGGWVPAQTNPISLPGLDPLTEYSVTVRAFTGDQYSLGSQLKTFTTSQAAVVAPTSRPVIGDIEATTESAQIFFSGVSNADGYIYRINGGAEVDIATVNPFTVAGLSDYQSFLVEMKAYNSAGESNWSDAVLFTTDALVPQVPSIASVETTNTQLTVNFNAVAKTDSYDVRLSTGQIVSVGSSPAVVEGLVAGSSGSAEVRAVNPAGPSDWSAAINYTMKQVPGQAQILSVEPDQGAASVTRTEVVGATGYEYRLDAGTPVDAGLVNPILINGLTVGVSYNIEVRAKNQWGGGQWSEPVTFVKPEETAPTIADPTLNVTNLTLTGFTLAFQKATDNKDETLLNYKYYEGDPALLNDLATIETQQLRQTAVNVAQFIVSASEGEFKSGNVLVEDQAGNKSIYTPFDVLIPEQEVSDVEIYDQDPAVYTSSQPIASFQNSGTVELSSEQGTIRLHAKVEAFEGADDTVTWSTSDATKVSITVIDPYTADITYVASQAGDVVTITATSDFDTFFKASVDVNLYADTAVADTESTTFELQT